MTTQPMQFVPGSEFKRRAAEVVANPFLRKSFRGAMDFLIAKRAAQFPDPQLLERQRTLAEEIRRDSFRGEHLATFLWHNTEKNEGSKA